MPCHCPLNSRKADWARTEDEVEKTASFRGTKARRATTRRGSPRNRGVCEWGRRGWDGEGGEGVEVPCRHLFQRPSTRTSCTRLEEKGGLGIPRPKPTQASPRSRSFQGWSQALHGVREGQASPAETTATATAAASRQYDVWLWWSRLTRGAFGRDRGDAR